MPPLLPPKKPCTYTYKLYTHIDGALIYTRGDTRVTITKGMYSTVDRANKLIYALKGCK